MLLFTLESTSRTPVQLSLADENVASQHMNWTELNWTDLQQVDPVTRPSRHARRRRSRLDWLQRNSTSVAAQRVLEPRIPARLYALEFAAWSSVLFSSCAVKRSLTAGRSRSCRNASAPACVMVSPPQMTHIISVEWRQDATNGKQPAAALIAGHRSLLAVTGDRLTQPGSASLVHGDDMGRGDYGQTKDVLSNTQWIREWTLLTVTWEKLTVLALFVQQLGQKTRRSLTCHKMCILTVILRTLLVYIG